MSLITVLTPTYNREKKLKKLFESLLRQTDNDFVWLVVDDGSTDKTVEQIQGFMARTPFNIELIQKENGGKHTALNIGFPHIKTELTFIVDSDDILTDDAIETIKKAWSNKPKVDVAGISFLRGYSETRVIGDEFPKSDAVMNDIDIRFRYHIRGDKAEVWRTDFLNQYRFPVFADEKFQGENYIWWQIAEKYDMLYINKIIYITEYLEGGLTQSGRAMRIRCAKGGMENSLKGFGKRFPLKARLKHAILFNCYADFAGLSYRNRARKADGSFLIPITYIPAKMLYWYWKEKYMK